MSSKRGAVPSAPIHIFPGSIHRAFSFQLPRTPRQPQAHKLTQTHISIYCTAMGTHSATFSENALLSETKNTLTGQTGKWRWNARNKKKRNSGRDISECRGSHIEWSFVLICAACYPHTCIICITLNATNFSGMTVADKLSYDQT